MKRFEGRRKTRERYPYEPRMIGGKLVMPAELQRIHAIVQDAVEVEIISDEMRAVVETLWPELAYKLPPRAANVIAPVSPHGRRVPGQ